MIDALIRDFRQPEYLHVLINPLPIYGLAVGLIGYWMGRDVRAQNATVPIGAVIPPSPL